MTDAEITIIIPTRHRAHFLDVTVRTVLASAAELRRAHAVECRVVVVDDASEDDATRAVSRALGVDYLRVEQHDGHHDPGAAIVLGVRSVDTRYQTIFGDDDVMLTHHLRAGYERLRAGSDVVSASFQITDADLRVTRTVNLMPTDIGDLAAGFTAINDGSFVAHDDVADLEWDVTLEGQMLVPIWAELMVQGKSFAVMSEPSWLYRKHGGNLSQGALSPRDLALRERAKARIRDTVLRELGHIPPSHRAEMEAARTRFKERTAKNPSKFLRRVRSDAARVVAPKPFEPETYLTSLQAKARRRRSD